MKTVIGYCRVSTRRQGQSGLGLEAQQADITHYCEVHGYELERIETEVASGKLDETQRPVLKAALDDARSTGATLLVAKLCRLSRKSLLVDQWLTDGIDFEDVQSGPTRDKTWLKLKAIFNEEEADRISTRTREALAAKRARGEPLGNLKNLEAHRHRGSCTIADRALEFAESCRASLELIGADRLTTRQVADKLNELRVPNRSGGRWNHTGIGRVMQRLQLT